MSFIPIKNYKVSIRDYKMKHLGRAVFCFFNFTYITQNKKKSKSQHLVSKNNNIDYKIISILKKIYY